MGWEREEIGLLVGMRGTSAKVLCGKFGGLGIEMVGIVNGRGRVVLAAFGGKGVS